MRHKLLGKDLPVDPNLQRMLDLLRHQRMELHEAELINDDEYAELAQDHPAVARLETYDGMRAALRDIANRAGAPTMTYAPAIQIGEQRDSLNWIAKRATEALGNK